MKLNILVATLIASTVTGCASMTGPYEGDVALQKSYQNDALNTVTWVKPSDNNELYTVCADVFNTTVAAAKEKNISGCMWKSEDHICHVVASDCEDNSCFRVLGYALQGCESSKTKAAYRNYSNDLWNVSDNQ